MKYHEHCSKSSLSDVSSKIVWSNLLHFKLIYYLNFTLCMYSLSLHFLVHNESIFLEITKGNFV